MNITCDDCGSVQSDTRQRCELCGASLAEEKERGDPFEAVKLAIAAAAATAVLMIGPGVLLLNFRYYETPASEFWPTYLAIWCVGGLLARFFRPRDNLEVDRHLWRYQRDGWHLFIGLALLPMGIVFGLWEGAVRALFKR